MAKSGTITSYFYGNGYDNLCYRGTQEKAVYSLTLSWEVKSQSIIANTSTISWSLRASMESQFTADGLNVAYYYGTPSHIIFGTDEVQGNNNPYNDLEIRAKKSSGGSYEIVYKTTTLSKALYAEQKDLLIDSGEFTVNHDAQGNYNETFYCKFRIKNAYDINGDTIFKTATTATDIGRTSEGSTNSATINPDSIPRKAVITAADDFYDEQSPTMEFVIPNTASSVQVGISFTGAEMNIPYRAVNKTATSYTFNFTSTEMNTLISYLRSSGVKTDDGLAAPVRFYILTDGQTDYVTRTATLIDYVPFLEPEIYDTNQTVVNNLTGDSSILVKYISHAYYSINALGRKGASISTQTARNGDLTLGTATGTFEGPTDYKFYFSVIDNYGNRSNRVKEVNFVDYVKLTCSAKVGEMTAEGKVSITISGKYFNSTFGKVQNTLSLYYQVTKKNGDSRTVNWHEIKPTMSGDNYSYTFLIENLEYLSVYDLVIEVKDKAMPSPAHTEVILASEPIFDWGRNDFNFNVPVSFNGVPMMDFICEQGVSGNWTYRKWNSGLMECWGFIKGTVDVMTQWGGVYRSNATIQDYFPISFTSYPVVQATPSYDNYGNYWLATFSTQSGMNKTPSYQICLGENAVNVNYKISFYAIGK